MEGPMPGPPQPRQPLTACPHSHLLVSLPRARLQRVRVAAPAPGYPAAVNQHSAVAASASAKSARRAVFTLLSGVFISVASGISPAMSPERGRSVRVSRNNPYVCWRRCIDAC
eukprot:364451-Chlamydomonas_euryale.AAC.5